MSIQAPRAPLRFLAAAAAAIAAFLYLLIGFEVVYIGESTTGEDPGLLGFGLSAGITFALIALLLVLVDRRAVWIAAGLLSALVFIAYFAMGSIREPSYEAWGLLIKAMQAVVVLVTGYLLLRASRATEPMRPAGHHPSG